MGPLRRLLNDRLNGGMLAALIAYALVFQAIGGSVAASGMAAALAESGSATHASHLADGDRQAGLPECCAVLCAVACAAGAGLSPEIGADLGPALAASFSAPAPAAERPRPLRLRALRSDARAPPSLSA